MNSNRIEVITNVVPNGKEFRVEAQIRYIHDTVVKKVVDVTGESFSTEVEAKDHKKVLEKTIMRTLAKVKNSIPSANLFKHEFKK
jgi:hypothetical protein